MSEINTPKAVGAAINETLALLDTNYNFGKALRSKVVVFVGVTGAGKSTACQFLAGNRKLKAIRDEFTNSYHITDGDDKVSDFTTQSKTFLPELVPIPNTGQVLVDCPGFSDTRGAEHDIAATFNTKKLLDLSQKVKIMVITPYHSVKHGVDRTAFTKLLDHLAQFIQNIDKYENSIGLLVTKVDNPTEEIYDGVFDIVNDEQIIESIGSFLKYDVQPELKDKKSKQYRLVEIFIEKNDDNKFSKIAIFRRPTNNQDLYSNKLLKENRNAMMMFMENELEYSLVNSNDFETSLSIESMYFLAKVRRSLHMSLSNILDDYIRVYTLHQLQDVDDNLESIKTGIQCSNSVINLLNSAIVPDMLVTNLITGIKLLNPKHPAEKFAEWKQQQKYLKKLDTISATQGEYSEYDRYHRRLVEFKEKISINVKKLGEQAEKKIDEGISEVMAEVMAAVKTEIDNVDISSQLSYKKVLDQIEDVYSAWFQFRTNSLSIPNLRFKELLNEFKATSSISNVSRSHIQTLEFYQTEIDNLKHNVTYTLTDGHQSIWLEGFIVPLHDIKTVADWYSFIVESHSKLIDYENLSALTNNMGNLKNWTNFKVMLQQIPNSKLSRFVASRSILSTKEQCDLNNLIDFIQSSPEYSCASSKCMVNGYLIVLSKVVANLFPKCASFEELYIFATHTVFIDASLVLPGKNVYILAPIWKIVGIREINLRGIDGAPKNEVKAWTEGARGMAGRPGQPGGNFVGIADKFVNADSLTINVSGGNGGNGVMGQTGENGTNGFSTEPSEFIFLDWYSLASRVKIVDHTSRKKVFGTDGTPGSRGGNGGKAGYGGKPGIMSVNSPHIIKLTNLGQNGTDGPGGKGGNGGEHGKIRHYENLNLFCIMLGCWEEVLVEDRGNATSGDDGVAGVYGEPATATPPQSSATLQTLAHQYTQYACQKQSPFVEQLESINSIVTNKHVIHAAPIGDKINSTVQHAGINHKSGNLDDKFWSSGFSLAAFVNLADVLIRKLMKTTPTNDRSQTDPNREELFVQAEVLKIVDRCGDKWNEGNQENGPLQEPFDPICLQKELHRRLRQLADKSQVSQIEADIMEKYFN